MMRLNFLHWLRVDWDWISMTMISSISLGDRNFVNTLDALLILWKSLLSSAACNYVKLDQSFI
jgi:hypothetical protein